MFRENVLTKDDIINRISKTMVPVAVDRWKAEDSKTKEAQFLQPFLKKHPANGSPCIYSPDGTVLGRFQGFSDMAGRTKTLIENALEAFGPVKPRDVQGVETHPFRGKGVMSDGSVSLAEYVRRKDRSKIKSPVISSVTLTKKEFRAFAPKQVTDGWEWNLPDSVAKKLCRVASPMCYQHAPQANWVKDVAIKARVRAVRNGVAELSYEGKMSSERVMNNGTILSKQQLEFTGEAVYDIDVGNMRSIIILGSGIFRWPEEAPDKLVPFDALIEWDRESATKN